MRYRSCVLALAVAAWALPSAPVWGQFSPNHPALTLDVGGHTAPVSQALFTHNSKELITVSRDKTIRFWDVGTGTMLRVLRPPVGPGREGELHTAALSPDGKVLAVASFGFFHGQGQERARSSPIYLIDVKGGQMIRVLTGHAGDVHALAFSRDGKHLASGGGGGVIKVWDVGAGKEHKSLKGHSGSVTSLAFSPDGKHLLSGAKTDEEGACLWSVASGTHSRLKGPHKQPVAQVAWSPDGTRLATGGADFERFVGLWDGDGKHLKNLHYTNYNLSCQSLAFMPDGKSVVVSSLDAWRSNVFRLDVADGKAAATYVEQNYFESEDVANGPAAVSPDGRVVAVAGDRQYRVHLYDGRKGGALRLCGGALSQPSLVAWNREKDADSRTIVWRTRVVPKDYEHGKPIPAHFFDHAFRLGELRTVPVPEGAEARYQLNRWGFAPLHLEMAYGGKTLRLYRDKKPTDVVLEPRKGRFMMESISFAGPERAVFATSEGLLDLYDVSDKGKGKSLGFLAGFNGSINSVAPSPDNGRYLLGGGEDQVLHVWDPHRMRSNDATKVHPGRLLSLFVAPSPGAPGKAKLSADWIAWTPEGYYTASAGGERLMGWHVNNGPDQMGTFHPASRFRAKFYRPDVMSRLLKEGSLEKALQAAAKAGGEKARDATVLDVAKVLPPKVDVEVSPPKGDKVEITARARLVGTEPVVAMQLLVDERPWTGADALKPVAAPKYEATWTVELPAGEHQIRVLARTASSLGTSRGVRAMVREEAPESEKTTRPDLYVLVVGIDAYPAMKLGGAVNDAVALEQAFVKNSSPLFRKIETKRLADKEATRQGILAGLDWLKEHMTAKDVAVFFFAGHGFRDKDGEFYLLPQDGDPKQLAGTALSRPEIKRRMQGLPGRILVLLDACHSGAIGLLFDDLSRELIDEDCGVVVMCAARPQQPAQEKDGHGYFTRSVVGGLSGKAGKRDGCVYLHHLQQYVIDNVLELSHDQQHPVAVAPPWLRPFGLSKP